MFFTRVLAVALAAVVVAATPSPTTKRALSFNPLDVLLTPLEQLLNAPAPPKRLTNAERIARGLSPNKPNFARRQTAAKARRSSTPCVPTTGVIAVQIQNADGTTRNAFVGSSNSFGEFQPTDDRGSAMALSFCADDPTSTFDIQTTSGGFSNFPYLAFIAGFANTSPNFSSGSFNYAYLGASTQTPAGSPAVTQPNSFSSAAGIPEGVETNVWTYDAGSGSLTPHWVNSDGSQGPTTLLYVASSNAFAITGDAVAFGSNFGTGLPASFSFAT